MPQLIPPELLNSSRRADPRVYPFVLVFLIFTVTSYIFVYFDAEPYPAIMMPGFAGTGAGNSDLIRVTAHEFVVYFEDRDSAHLPMELLFDPFPSSHWGTLLRNFRPEDEGRSASKLEAGALGVLLPGARIRAQRRALGAHDPSISNWLRKQVAKQYPSKTPAKMEFRWFQERYRPGTDHPLSRTHRGTRVVDLSSS